MNNKSYKKKFRVFPFFLAFCLLGICTLCKAQSFIVQYADNSSAIDELQVMMKQGARYDSSEINKALALLPSRLKQKGYLFQRLDTTFIVKDTFHISWYGGPRLIYRFVAEEEQSQIAKDAGIAATKLDELVVDTIRQNYYATKIIQYLSDNGYPFVTGFFQSSLKDSSDFELRFHIDKGPYVVVNDVFFNEDIKISKQYLYQMLGIKKESTYSKYQIQTIANKIRNLSFLEMNTAPKLSFLANRASIFLPLKEKKASKFDFIIGVLPSTNAGKRTWTINGEFLGDFINKFGQGERFSINFKRLSLEDQFLKMSASLPFVLSSPFGVDGSFEIKRNRNITLDVNANIGSKYTINSTNQIKAYWTYKSSSLLNPDLALILNQGKLPQNLDIRYRGGGIEYDYTALDYIFNPRKGWTSRINGSLGLRSFVKNQQILTLSNEKVDFANAYDSISKANLQFNLEIEFEHFLPISNLGALRNRVAFAQRYNNGNIIQNELYRIGGNRLLRGFNELGFLSDFYIIYTGEFRLILDQNSFLNLPFIDLAWLRNRNNVNDERLVPAYGIGMGMNFSTKAGIFNLTFAAGNYDNTGFDFANTKIHFGYLNLF